MIERPDYPVASVRPAPIQGLDRGRAFLRTEVRQTSFPAWRQLDRFAGRAPLRHWLPRIAPREFLRSLRSKRAQLSLEEAGDLPAPRGEAWTEAVELRELIRTLPRPQREAAVLSTHCVGTRLEG